MYRTLSAVAAVFITAMMFVPPALAQSATISASAPMSSGMYQTRAARVSLAGLDMNTAQGAAAALDRIDAASRVVCGDRSGYRMSAHRAQIFYACHSRATREAVAKLNAPELTQLAAVR